MKVKGEGNEGRRREQNRTEPNSREATRFFDRTSVSVRGEGVKGGMHFNATVWRHNELTSGSNIIHFRVELKRVNERIARNVRRTGRDKWYANNIRYKKKETEEEMEIEMLLQLLMMAVVDKEFSRKIRKGKKRRRRKGDQYESQTTRRSQEDVTQQQETRRWCIRKNAVRIS